MAKILIYIIIIKYISNSLFSFIYVRREETEKNSLIYQSRMITFNPGMTQTESYISYLSLHHFYYSDRLVRSNSVCTSVPVSNNQH